MERSIVPEERLIDLQLTKEMQERFCEARPLHDVSGAAKKGRSGNCTVRRKKRLLSKEEYRRSCTGNC